MILSQLATPRLLHFHNLHIIFQYLWLNSSNLSISLQYAAPYCQTHHIYQPRYAQSIDYNLMYHTRHFLSSKYVNNTKLKSKKCPSTNHALHFRENSRSGIQNACEKSLTAWKMKSKFAIETNVLHEDTWNLIQKQLYIYIYEKLFFYVTTASGDGRSQDNS